MDPKRRKSSDLWSFFEQVDNHIALCNICKVKISFKGSISNLKKHLQRKHPTIALPIKSSQTNLQAVAVTETSLIEVLQPGPEVQENLTAETSSNLFTPNIPSTSRATVTTQSKQVSLHLPASISTKQMQISAFIPKKFTVTDKNKIDDAVMKLIIWDFQPFSVVEDKGFRNLLNTCTPNYKIPSRKYFANTLLPAFYEKKVNEIKNSIKHEALSVCLTTDMWSSSTNDNYNAVTAHYITEDFEMKNVMLDCSAFQANKTSKNLADEILCVVNEWELAGKILIVITDNAANITNAIKNILNWKHYGCYAHKLNLIVQDSLSLVYQIIKKVKIIVSFFKRSNAANLKLVKYQEQTGIHKPKKLLQDVVTRWNSVYYMLRRFIELEEAIKHSMALLTLDIETLTPEEWETCKELCIILEPCEEVTKEMSGEKYMTASQIIPITRGLKSTIKKISEKVRKPVIKEIAIKLLEGISIRYANLEQSKTISLCTLLDPRYKHYFFEDRNALENTKKNAAELVAAWITKNRNTNQTVNEGNMPSDVPESEETKISIWDDYDQQINRIKPIGTPLSMAMQEIHRYLEDIPISRKENPLLWWKNHIHAYPNLSYLVRTKCNMVATSVPCERIFSKTGIILSERRTRLTSRKVQQLTFLNMNSN